MTTTPDGSQSQPFDPGQPPQASSGGEGPQASPARQYMGGCLTAAEIAELVRQGWEEPAEDDPACWQNPDTAAPEWWEALPGAEQARQIEEGLGPAPGVPESIAAGFTHRDGGNGRGFEAGGVLDVMPPGGVLAGVRRR